MNEENMRRESPAGGAGFSNKLLVVGHETGFSDFMMSYSLQMATRMNYSIVALNLLLVVQRKWPFSDSAAAQEELKKRGAEGAETFARKAAEAGIGFAHLFRVGDLDEVVRGVHKERGDIDLVLVEPEYLNIDKEDPFTIPVFSLVPNHT